MQIQPTFVFILIACGLVMIGGYVVRKNEGEKITEYLIRLHFIEKFIYSVYLIIAPPVVIWIFIAGRDIFPNIDFGLEFIHLLGASTAVVTLLWTTLRYEQSRTQIENAQEQIKISQKQLVQSEHQRKLAKLNDMYRDLVAHLSKISNETINEYNTEITKNSAKSKIKHLKKEYEFEPKDFNADFLKTIRDENIYGRNLIYTITYTLSLYYPMEKDRKKYAREILNFQAMTLFGINLRFINLKDANLQWANLRGADLQWADLQWVNLKDANLQWADLERTNLQNAKLEGSELEEAHFKRADLTSTNINLYNKPHIDKYKDSIIGYDKIIWLDDNGNVIK